MKNEMKNEKHNVNKKGISALVATVLLTVFVISLGLVVINWSSKLIGEGIEKSESKIGSSLECADVNIKIESKPGKDSTIIIKNNNENDMELKGFITRFFMNDNVVVDYANKDSEIKAFGAKEFDFSNHQTKNAAGNPDVLVKWNGENRVEIIPRVDIGEEIVNCDNRKVIWEK
ncbi:hypothetical protein HYV89_00075 [Candidatus Woesearchaeota archaeon]|nr:hypothetical protein [Candidatus Woesearchaeota archaeon]